jgi:nitrate reductase gamma subunit
MGTEIAVFLFGALTIFLTLLGVYGLDMDIKMMIFTPIISLAVGTFSLVLYRNVALKLRGIWEQWHATWSRNDLSVGALARGFVIEVLFQRKLFRDNRIRWIRHILIYWGFVGLWMADMAFFFTTKLLHLSVSDPILLFLKLALESYGAVLLLGLTLALIRAFLVRAGRGSIYNDTPAVALFFLVTATGFILEALRLLSLPYEPYLAWSFVGLALARFMQGWNLPWNSLYEGVWLFHALIASASIAYIPLSRMVHIFAVPTGRLLESQQEVLAAKVRAVSLGLMGH